MEMGCEYETDKSQVSCPGRPPPGVISKRPRDLLLQRVVGRPFHPITITMSTRKSPSAPPVCLGRLLGAGCDGSLEKGETLFQKYLCTSCLQGQGTSRILC